MRHLIGITDESRQQYREELMGTTVADFKEFADVLEMVKENGIVVVMGAGTAVNAANEDDWLTISKVM
jgi:Zn-dependent M16 (insulinase) family peptidase